MKITQEHCEKTADTFPRQRGNVTFDNLTMLIGNTTKSYIKNEMKSNGCLEG